MAALVYDYLKNTAGTVAEAFKQKVHPVRRNVLSSFQFNLINLTSIFLSLIFSSSL